MNENNNLISDQSECFIGRNMNDTEEKPKFRNMIIYFKVSNVLEISTN